MALAVTKFTHGAWVVVVVVPVMVWFLVHLARRYETEEEELEESVKAILGQSGPREARRARPR